MFPNDEEQLKHVHEDILEQLNSVSGTDSAGERVSDMDEEEKKILRQRILLINNHTTLDTRQKTKLIQKLMMKDVRKKLVLEDIYNERSVESADKSFELTRQNSNESDLDTAENDARYSAQLDYNIINSISCDHFDSRVKLYSRTTKLWYSCKNCYILATDQSLETLSHFMCGKCKAVAPVGEKDSCFECENKYAEYCCLKCRIFENNEENVIYHCDFCKECKLGEGLGVDYNHCFDCNCCMPLEMFHNEQVSHKCIKNNLSSDCPICGVKLNEHHSKQTRAFEASKDNWKVQFLIPCNHAIHETCLQLYLDNGQYKCPICQISIVDMEINFKLLDEEIHTCLLPMPYNTWRCVYKCNDCDTRGITNYHFLGIKCRSCYSFNTILLQVLKNQDGDEVLEEKEVGTTKRSTVSKEMVNNTFMSRGDSFKGKEANDMDGFLNDFLSKDEDLSLSHLLVGLKQYYYTKKKEGDNEESRNNSAFESLDVNRVYTRLKTNLWAKIRGSDSEDQKEAFAFKDEQFTSDSLTEEHENSQTKNTTEPNSRNTGLLNDIGDSFKQFLKFLEDNEGHED